MKDQKDKKKSFKELDKYKKLYLKYFKNGKYNELINMIDKILFKYNINEFNSILLRQKGDCYSRLKKRKKAIQCYEESLKIDKSDKNFIEESIAGTYYFDKQYNLAKEGFLKIIKRGTDDPLIIVFLLEIFIKNNKYNEAYKYIEENKKKIKDFLDDPDYLSQYARILEYFKKYDEAIEHFVRSFKRGNDNYYYYENIGDCYYELKDYKNAVKYYEKLLKKEKDYFDIYKKIVKTYKALDDTNKAEYYEKKLKNIKKSSKN